MGCGKNFCEGVEVIWVVEGGENGGTKTGQRLRHPDGIGVSGLL